MKTRFTLWFSPHAEFKDSRFHSLISSYHLDNFQTRTLQEGSIVDKSHVNLYIMPVTSRYYSNALTIEDLDLSVDKHFIDIASNKGIRCVIDYSWEASSIKHIANYEFYKRNEKLIQDYDIQLLSNTSSETNHKLNSGKDFFLKFPMFSYEVRSTNAHRNMHYHLNTSICLKEQKKYFFNLFAGDIDKFKNIVTMASFYRRGLEKHSAFSAILGHNDSQIDKYDKEFGFYKDATVHYPDPDTKSTFEYLKENEDKILHKHLPFERYEGDPNFDVNFGGSGYLERRIPQVAHESHMWCVMETLSAHDIIHHTEKTFKPISVGHPFMVLGSANENKDLKRYGYELYDEIINYDFEEPHKDDPAVFSWFAIEKYFNEVERLIKEGPGIFYQKSVLEKVEWNKHNFQKQTTRDALQKNLTELFS